MKNAVRSLNLGKFINTGNYRVLDESLCRGEIQTVLISNKHKSRNDHINKHNTMQM
jgi:hypothetical protein